MLENKFCICEHCGNLIAMIRDSGVPMMCCGKRMTKLEAGAIEASAEKHVPVVDVNESTVTVMVGAAEHPMTDEHSILWVCLQTDKGGQRKCLEVGKRPAVSFALSDEKPLAVYAYCNLHGLWVAEITEPAVCDLKPLDIRSQGNYVVCKCNNVTYFDILDEIHNQKDATDLLEVFEKVKNTTHCSGGCGGCYEKVIAIISAAMSGQ